MLGLRPSALKQVLNRALKRLPRVAHVLHGIMQRAMARRNMQDVLKKDIKGKRELFKHTKG